MLPNLGGFVIILINCNPELVLIDSVLFGDEVPRQWYRFRLEVVSEGKVSEHFKEGMMSGGLTDVFQIIVLPPARTHF